MSLKLAKTFISSIRGNADLNQLLGADADGKGARIFTVARPESDENEDRIPYLVVLPESIQSEGNKDGYRGTDTVTIGLLCVASTFFELIELTELVQEDVESIEAEQDGYYINDFTFSANAVQMDTLKPCYYQTLTYIVNIQKA